MSQTYFSLDVFNPRKLMCVSFERGECEAGIGLSRANGFILFFTYIYQPLSTFMSTSQYMVRSISEGCALTQNNFLLPLTLPPRTMPPHSPTPPRLDNVLFDGRLIKSPNVCYQHRITLSLKLPITEGRFMSHNKSSLKVISKHWSRELVSGVPEEPRMER